MVCSLEPVSTPPTVSRERAGTPVRRRHGTNRLLNVFTESILPSFPAVEERTIDKRRETNENRKYVILYEFAESTGEEDPDQGTDGRVGTREGSRMSELG